MFTATDPVDYDAPIPSEVTFPQGAVEGDTECVTVTITNDATPEPTEHFTITLGSHIAEVDESLSIHTVTIEDDDSERFKH